MEDDAKHPLPEFSQAIEDLFRVVGRKNFSALAEATGIHRHMLRRMVDGEDVSLKLSQIRALNAHLWRHGIELLATPTLLEKMATGAPTLCVLPSYRNPENKEQSTSSPWDVLAMTTVRDAMARYHQRASFKLKYVHGKERSIDELDRDAPVNLVLIGSPRAYCIADEVLCRMFFDDAVRSPNKLPFRFYWGDDPQHEAESPFRLSRKELLQNDLSRFDEVDVDEVKRGSGRAFLCNRAVCPVVRKKSLDTGAIEYKSYGVAVAQKRKNQFWLCVTGLDGPATTAVGIQLLTGLSAFNIPFGEATSAVIWFAIECVVVESPGSRQYGGETREIQHEQGREAVRVISGPNIWDPLSVLDPDNPCRYRPDG